MDELRLDIEIVDAFSNEQFTYKEIVYYVNGQKLVDMISRDYEYVGIDLSDLYRIKYAHFGREPQLWDEVEWYKGKILVFVCGGCSTVGCHDCTAEIRFEEDRVIWSNFEYPDRQVGPFIFDRKQYEAEFSRILEQYTPPKGVD